MLCNKDTTFKQAGCDRFQVIASLLLSAQDQNKDILRYKTYNPDSEGAGSIIHDPIDLQESYPFSSDDV